MSLLLDLDVLKHLIQKISLQQFFTLAIDALRQDFERWHEFSMIPRVATHYPHGVIELMPASDDKLYAFKYVNGHPNNPRDNKLTVTAVGMLSEVKSGYPLLISEMTVLTAIRTAATSALASSYLAPENTHSFGLIGTGAQSEFQTLAHKTLFDIKRVYYFDIDERAMKKFADNMSDYGFELIACASAEEVAEHADIITTATADKTMARILSDHMVSKGVHINAIGGDCPDKTEIGLQLLERSKIVIEYLDQTRIEGEIQNLDPNNIHAELWQIICGEKKGRESDQEVTLFDSVGIALEDYSILRLVYRLLNEYSLGQRINLIPQLDDPKNLFTLI